LHDQLLFTTFTVCWSISHFHLLNLSPLQLPSGKLYAVWFKNHCAHTRSFHMWRVMKLCDLNHYLPSTICIMDSELFGHAQDLTFAQGLLINHSVYLALFTIIYICIISGHISVTDFSVKFNVIKDCQRVLKKTTILLLLLLKITNGFIARFSHNKSAEYVLCNNFTYVLWSQHYFLNGLYSLITYVKQWCKFYLGNLMCFIHFLLLWRTVHLTKTWNGENLTVRSM
jgi:hypothetical protein